MEGEEKEKRKVCPSDSGEKKSHSFYSPFFRKEFSFHHTEKSDLFLSPTISFLRPLTPYTSSPTISFLWCYRPTTSSPTISFLWCYRPTTSYTVHFQSHHFISLMLQTNHFVCKIKEMKWWDWKCTVCNIKEMKWWDWKCTVYTKCTVCNIKEMKWWDWKCTV